MTSPAAELSGAGDAPASRQASFARLAWGVLGFTLLVILFGAVVRITGSGAGCGQHWPTCQGEVVHLPKTAATAIELSHRLTSGLSLVLVVGLAIAAFRRFAAGHAVRRMAAFSVAFMITESLVGAALVLLRLVGQNTSVVRAVVMAVHLVNTSFLTAAIALTAWLSIQPAPRRWLPEGRLGWTLAGTLLATLAVSVTGAVTALGDTLYPVNTTQALAERIAADHSVTANFLERGRAVHPLVAFGTALFVLFTAWNAAEARPDKNVVFFARAAMALVFTQVGAGVLNILLSAPGWMQVTHLALATLVWLSLVLLYTASAGARGFENRLAND